MQKTKQQEKYLRPADFIIFYFGGLRPAARAIGRSHASINKWRRRQKDGGCDGFIPRKAMHIILNLAAKKGYKIEALDLLLGRVVRVDGK